MRRFFVAAVLALFGVFFAAKAEPALAHHEEYAAMDLANPFGGPPNLTANGYNFLVRKWWLGQSNTLTWKANPTTLYDPYAGGRLDYVVPIVLADFAAGKSGTMGRLHWQVTTGTPDIMFDWAAGPCGAAGCFMPTWTYYPQEDAAYITGGTILIDYDTPRTANALRGVVGHEVAHVYGRSDGYGHDPNNPVLGVSDTITNGSYWMPSGVYGPGSQCPPGHLACEAGIWRPGSGMPPGGLPPVVGPTTEDGDTISAFYRGKPAWYSGGYYSRHNGVALGYVVHRYPGTPYLVAFTWMDYVWADRQEVLWFEKETSPGVWTSVAQWLSFDTIGRHYDFADGAHKVIWQNFNLAPYGPGNYRPCALPIMVGMSDSTGGEFGDYTYCGYPESFP